MHRNLLDGLHFGLSMIAGAAIGGCLFTPAIGSGPPGDTMQMVFGVIFGTIVAGIAWQFCRAGRKPRT